MNRRTFLRSATVIAAAAGSGLAGPSSPIGSRYRASAAEPASPNRAETVTIVLVGHKPDHPPGTHLYLEECRLLAGCLEQTPGVQAVVSDGWPQDEALLARARAIVLYSSAGADILLADGHARQAESLLRKGLGFSALHWATGVRDAKNTQLAERYLRVLGGVFGMAGSGLDFSNSRVEQLDPKHPVCRGWSDYDLKDEWYLGLKFLPDTKPLFKVRVKDKDQVVGWVYERPNSGGGRSYGNTLGHFHENFLMEPFRRAIVNGILWTAHCEIPEGGAPCRIKT